MTTFLGLDSSTQSLSALLIDADTGKVVADRSVNFGERLPHYKSPKGFLAHPDEAVKHSDPLMWVEALELVLDDLRAAGVDLGTVRGISGAGQQHGSVYLGKSMDKVGDWAPGTPLHEQVRPLLSRKTSPIWMDSSTSAECAEIAKAAGGDERCRHVGVARGRRMVQSGPPACIARVHRGAGLEQGLGRCQSLELGTELTARIDRARAGPHGNHERREAVPLR